jgi:hypothetical protein
VNELCPSTDILIGKVAFFILKHLEKGPKLQSWIGKRWAEIDTESKKVNIRMLIHKNVLALMDQGLIEKVKLTPRCNQLWITASGLEALAETRRFYGS